MTADGEIRRVDAETEPDLFWAIRGGGGNFGVATRFRFRLHELDTVVGGMLMLPATVETIAGFMAESKASPEELGTIANVMKAPPLPFVPEEAHGKLVIMALMAYAGDTDAGQRASRRSERSPSRWRTCSGPCRTPRSTRPSRRAITPSRSLGRCSSTTSAAPRPRRSSSTSRPRPRRRGGPVGGGWRALRTLGGAMARVPVDATAFAHREPENVVAIFAARRSRWRPAGAGAPSARRRSVRQLPRRRGRGAVRAAYPGATWDRLRQIKARFDPTNLFHLNQNIPPAAA